MSNRLSLLIALQQHGASTYDDLEQTTGMARDKLRISTNDAKKAGHVVIAKDKDPVTGLQVFELTSLGEQWIKANSPKAAVDSVVREYQTTEMPSNKVCCNAATVVATTAGAEVAALNQQLVAKDEWIEAAKAKLASAEQQRDENQRLFHDAIRSLARIDEALGLGDDGIADPETTLEAIETLRQEMQRLAAENLALTTLTDAAPCFNATLEALPASGYIVITPGKPIRRFFKAENAARQALATARAGRPAEVFALRAEGKAVRGAEWKPHSEPVPA